MRSRNARRCCFRRMSATWMHFFSWAAVLAVHGPKVMTEEWVIKFPASREMPEVGAWKRNTWIARPPAALWFLKPGRSSPSVAADILPCGVLTGTGCRLSHPPPYADGRRYPGNRLAHRLHGLPHADEAHAHPFPEQCREHGRRCTGACASTFSHTTGTTTPRISAGCTTWHRTAGTLLPPMTSPGVPSIMASMPPRWMATGKNPGMQELLAVGKAAGMKAKACREIAEEIWDKTEGLEWRYRGMRS